MVFKTLISAGELHRQGTLQDWVIVDCSFDLAQPEWGLNNYRSAHIPGAVYAHLNRDLSAPQTATSGRHPLPDSESIMLAFGRCGISSSTQVVAYDQGDGSMAARLWWLLRYYGHETVAVLDGGFAAWSNAKYPVETGDQARTPVRFSGYPNPGMVADLDLVKSHYLDPQWLLVDSRAPERHRGEMEPIDAIAGHIPGSVNLYFGNNLAKENRYKTRSQLRRLWTNRISGHDPTHVIVYCGSGVTSCANLLALEIAGISGSLLFPGSWSQWIKDPQNPVSVGA